MHGQQNKKKKKNHYYLDIFPSPLFEKESA